MTGSFGKISMFFPRKGHDIVTASVTETSKKLKRKQTEKPEENQAGTIVSAEIPPDEDCENLK